MIIPQRLECPKERASLDLHALKQPELNALAKNANGLLRGRDPAHVFRTPLCGNGLAVGKRECVNVARKFGICQRGLVNARGGTLLFERDNPRGRYLDVRGGHLHARDNVGQKLLTSHLLHNQILSIGRFGAYLQTSWPNYNR